ncbi:MAG: GAF domain-containing protein [Chloroflexota bacterium]
MYHERPLFVGSTVGTLNIASKTPMAYGPAEMTLMRQITNLVGSAIQVRQLISQMQVSEARFRDIALSIADWVWETDVDGNYTYCSDRIVDVLGYTPDEVLGKTPYAYMPPDEIERITPDILKAVENLKPMVDLENRNVTKDGHEVYVSVNSVPILNEAGQLLGYRGVNRDITARKQAEESLRQALAEANTFQQLVIASNQGIGMTDLQGKVTYANPSMLEMLRVKGELQTEFYGQSIFNFYSQEVQAQFQENIIPTVLAQAQWSGELSLTIAEETIYTYQSYFLVRDEQGNPSQFAVIITDITERKQTERLLQEEKDRSQTILESLGTPIVIAKVADGTVIYVNQPLAELLQVVRTELVGRVTPDFFYEAAGRAAYVGALREKGIVSNYEVHLKRGNGEDFWALMSGQISRFEGELVTITSLVDISDRKAAETTLHKQALELRTVAEVSTTAATIRETNALLQQVVDLAQQRFELYHAHIYLLNAANNRLILAAGAGDVGREMVQQGHSIPLSQKRSLVVQAARQRIGVRVNDIRQDPAFLPNPLLPDTRAELAVPMIVGDNLLGVLDVQSDQVDRFQENDVNIQMTLAAQIAVALDNARSLERAQKALTDLNQLTQRLTREGWEAYLATRDETELAYSFSAEQLEEEPQVVSYPVNGHDAQIQQTLSIHGEMIGQLAIVPDDETEEVYDEETAAIINAVAEQLSARIENIRLTEQMQTALAETEEQALRLSKLNEAAAALNTAQNADEVFQISVEQTLSIINGNSASVTLLSEDGGSMILMAISGAAARLPLGTRFPLKQQQSLATAVAERRVIIEENIEAGTTESLADSYSAIVAPILSGTRVLGTLNVGASQINAFDTNDINLMRQMTALVASTLENQRLLEETQARAEQLAAINRIARTLSQYLDEEALLEAAYGEIEQTIQIDSFYVGLYNEQTNMIHFPIFYEGGKRLVEQPVLVDPQRYSYRVIHHGETILYNLTPEEQSEVSQSGEIVIGDRQRAQSTASLLFVPLQAGQRVLGVISAQSYQFNAYTATEEALLSGIAGYLAVALENVRLFAETEKRAAQLQALSEVETALSQAATEEEILTAVSLSIEFTSELPAMRLYYVDTDKSGQPQVMQTVAIWSDGLIQPNHDAIGQVIQLDDERHNWLTRTSELGLIPDISASTEIKGTLKETIQQAGVSAVAAIPLLSVGRWQGLITITWQNVHQFTESEQFLLRQVMEPVAAVVTSRRAQLAQQQALALTDNLYRAGRRINAAGPDLQEAVAAVAEAAPISAVNRLVFFLFEFAPTGQLEAARSVANWHSGRGIAPPPLNLRYTIDVLKGLESFVTRETFIFNDTQSGQLSPTIQQVLKQLNVPSMAVVPLWIGTRQLGSILIETDAPFTFDRAELEPYIALIDQLAIAVDRQRLLQQAQVRAERERQIRTITDKIRRGVDREAILRIAREEISQLLGASTAVTQLGTREQLLQQLQKLTQEGLDPQAV